MSSTENVTRQHQALHALVYVRQSSPKQVHHHRESQTNQYALVQRALALGWLPEHITVIDTDLGLSGRDGQRPGFRELVTEVSLGHVGIVLAYEASRLARNNADWYALLDLAALRGTLIGDSEGVYDPRTPNDRLLLGLRGMLSEAELHLLQLRLAAGRQRQIERGVFRQQLPTGLVRLPDGRVLKEPDLQIQRTIELVFARFSALGSCQKVLRSLRDDSILLPRRQTGGPDAGATLWKPPSEGAIYAILHNPAYAGAFVYGQHRRHPDSLPGQQAPRVHCTMDQWAVLHHDVYPAYISWEEFMGNQARLSENANRYHEQRRGAVRDGPALLAGLAVCARCGRLLHVEYKQHHHYVCSALAKECGVAICLYLAGGGIDAAVVEVFFTALQLAELAVLDDVLASQQAEHARLHQQYTDQVARTDYEARLAQRQYLTVDPDNRLVASELERRWELALRATTEAREAVERFASQRHLPQLDPLLRQQLSDLGPQMPALWASGRLSLQHKKELLRCLIRRVILDREQAERVDVTIVWVSGAMSQMQVPTTTARTAQLERYEELVARIAELSAAGFSDPVIAERLRQEGFRSSRQTSLPNSLVTRIRRSQCQVSVRGQFRSQAQVGGAWTVWGLARQLGVGRDWLYRRIVAGRVPAERHAVTGHYLIADDPLVMAVLQAEAQSHVQRVLHVEGMKRGGQGDAEEPEPAHD
ncbi:MAG TPA: recombinase family protein [Herpetosiphonaceae bacterium]|nr:recombinase family protein [Herpetosiphonaceae bacterium]